MTFIGEAESHQAHNIAAYRVGSRERRAIDARTIRSVHGDIIVKYFVSPLYKSHPSKLSVFPSCLSFFFLLFLCSPPFSLLSFLFFVSLSFPSFQKFSPFSTFCLLFFSFFSFLFFFIRSTSVVVSIRTVNLIDRSLAEIVIQYGRDEQFSFINANSINEDIPAFETPY